MKKKRIIIVTMALLMAFIGISFFTFYESNQWIEDGFLQSEGTATQNFAALVAANIQLSDNQVENLKEMSYNEVLKSKENKQLQELIENEYFTNKVKYAYIMVPLKKNEVK